MKKKLSFLIALVMAISLCVTPVVAQAVAPVTPPPIPVTPYDSVVVLDNKVPSGDTIWPVLDMDNMWAVLSFNASSATFEYNLVASGLEANHDYDLIYYADKPDRFVNWGGDNPGKLISTHLSTGTGTILFTGTVELNMNLPSIDDANISEYDYTAEYGTAHGAKIWLVPSECYDGGTPDRVILWQPIRFLFETDLIWYNDTDIDVVGLNAEMEEIVAISVTPTYIHFGDIEPGAGDKPGPNINVENIGTVTCMVDAQLAESGSVFEWLKLNSNYPNTPGRWDDVILSLLPTLSVNVPTALNVPATYSAQGVEYVDLVFYAYSVTP